MDAADVVAVLDRLEGAGLTVWLDGGWGIDALCGIQSRLHGDLDLVIARHDAAAAGDALAALGYGHDTAATPGLPARLVLAGPGGRQVDVHPVVLDSRGNGWQELGDGAWGVYPADGSPVSGSSAAGGCCLSAELQVRHHLGYPLGDTDRYDLRLLAERFGVALPPGVGDAAPP